MNYYKKGSSYIASDLDLSLEKVSEQEYIDWKTKQDTMSELKRKLAEIDEKSIRSVRAKIAGAATAEDDQFLAQLEEQAELLRQQIKDLQGE